MQNLRQRTKLKKGSAQKSHAPAALAMVAAVQLNTGASIPLLGFGTAGVSSYAEIKSAIIAAVQAGYRHIDTASRYGSEAAIGDALADVFQSGLVRREDIFVTSKAWCSEMDDILSAIQRSLSTDALYSGKLEFRSLQHMLLATVLMLCKSLYSRPGALKLEYLDLYLVHFPLKTAVHGQRPPKIEEIQPLDVSMTWKNMEQCVELGLTKAIGVSNFSPRKILEVLQVARIKPAVNQIELNPRWHQRELREICKEADIHISAWSPLGAPQQRWGSTAVLENPIIKEIATNHRKTPAQVALRWALDQGASVLPKSYSRARIIENSQIFDWSLTDEDHMKIATIEQKPTLRGVLLEDGRFYDCSLDCVVGE